MESRDRAQEALTEPAPVAATSPLRMWGYVVSLALLSFLQAPGRIVADTKIDLPLAPWEFLSRATHLWDGLAAFGQLQNQAYGYLWPMGPFFVLGDEVGVPAWIVQRLWWTLLLSLAFVGVVKVAKALDLGSPVAQVAAAYAFVLTPRVPTLLGASSVELWPTALVPWVLLVLIRGSQRGSVVRTGALAALLVVCAGGVNATAVSATLPLGVVWILTRAPGMRRWRLLFWWGLFTFVGTLWWLVPLFLLGGYSAPFLDYIETASVTSSATDMMRSLLGVSNWVAYLDPDTYQAGAQFLTTPFLMLNTALVVGLGLAGIVMRGSEHRRFMVYGLLVGLALVGFGYAGDLSGWQAMDRQQLLDAALSPLRNTHKYDGVLRLVLVLGLARFLAEAPRRFSETLGRPALLGAKAIIVVVIVGLVVPWTGSAIASSTLPGVPRYWHEVAAHLEEQSTGGTALLLPAASFGNYTWGTTRDDVMQPLATSRWATRNVIPLAEPGNVLFLDGVTAILESGRPSQDLAPMLRAAGVDQVVLRNDLDRYQLGAPDPAYVRSVLLGSPGIELESSFGPTGGGSEEVDESGTRIVSNGGESASYSAVEIFRVDQALGAATLVPAEEVVTVLGSPGSVAGAEDRFRVSPSDGSEAEVRDVVLTDTARRREEAFQAVRWNATATLPRDAEFQSAGPEAFHRTAQDDEDWQTAEVWTGVTSVTASSSQATIPANPPLDRSAHPGAVFDGDIATAWRTQRGADVEGSWWQVNFTEPTDVPSVSVTMAGDSLPIDRLRIEAGGDGETVEAPAPLEDGTFEVGFEDVTSLRITAQGVPTRLGGAVSIAEVGIEGLTPRRLLSIPQAPEGSQVRGLELERDYGRAACVDHEGSLSCEQGIELNGEDGDAIARQVTLAQPLVLDATMTGSLRRRPDVVEPLAEAVGVEIDWPDSGLDVAESPLAMLDSDPGTTWTGPQGSAWFELTFPEERTWESLQLTLDERAPAAMPTKLEISSGERKALRTVGEDGTVALPGWTTDSLRVDILATEDVVLTNGGEQRFAGAGISELVINGAPLDPTVSIPCGAGPELVSGESGVQTQVTTDLATLLRGGRVELEPCTEGYEASAPGQVELLVGDNELVADPTELLRVDRISLDSSTLAQEHRESRVPLELQTSGVSSPKATYVFEPGLTDRLLVLNQNYNRGWVATLEGETLEPVRVNGWQQAWRVPATSVGQVDFTYGPAGTYRAGIAIGLLLALGVLVVFAVASRRRGAAQDWPALVPAPTQRLNMVYCWWAWPDSWPGGRVPWRPCWRRSWWPGPRGST